MSLHKEALFVCLDDFCKLYEDWECHHLIPATGRRQRAGKLSLLEMLFIQVFFHLSGFRCFKLYYLYGICNHYRGLFADLSSYGRFVSLQPRLFMPLCVLLHHLSGEKEGLYFADSTHLPVYHNRRINRNKVFKGLAQRGKSSMGWLFGLKLHIVINHKGQIIALKITAGNTDDRAMLDALTQGLQGKQGLYLKEPVQNIMAAWASHDHRHPEEYEKLSHADDQQTDAEKEVHCRDGF